MVDDVARSLSPHPASTRPGEDPSARQAAVRAATLADLGAIAAIETASFHSDRLSARALRRLLTKASAVTLVHTGPDGGVNGYATVLFHRRRTSARLYSIAITAAERQRGRGAALLVAAEDMARAQGARAMTLEVRADRPDVQRFYANLGYATSGHRSHYYEDGVDAHTMRKSLTNPAGGEASPMPPGRLT